MNYEIRQIPLGLTFSKKSSKDQISNFKCLCWVKHDKKTLEHWTLIFGTTLENVTPSWICCTSVGTNPKFQNLSFENNFSKLFSKPKKLTVTNWGSSTYIPVSKQLPTKLATVVFNTTIHTPLPTLVYTCLSSDIVDWWLSVLGGGKRF